MANTDLAGGLFGVVWGIKGDLDYYAKGLGLKHYQRNDFCELGRSTTADGVAPGMHSYNFRLSAEWKTNLFTAAAWRASKGDRLHRLFSRIPYLSALNLEPDELHILYLGVAMYVLGANMNNSYAFHY